MFSYALDGERFYIPRRTRLYLWASVEQKQAQLLVDYMIPTNLGEPLVLDVGANVGEFSLALSRHGAVVHAFEPDPVEFKALERNCRGSTVHPHNIALWDNEESRYFYLSNATGDSSLFSEGGATDEKIKIQARTLDSWARENLAPDCPVSVLKVEAEGAEPEVLLGGVETLKRVHFVTVDVGFERLSQSTLPEVVNILIPLGFRAVQFGAPRPVILFHNQLF